MKNRLWMVLFTTAALSLSACGGDANGNGDATEMDDTADAMTDDAAGDIGEPQSDEGGEGAANGTVGSDQELPEGVTMAMVEQGQTVFEGPGICTSCHGPAGEGIPNLGDNLTDDQWLHSDGDYEAVVETIMTGVTAEESTSGVPMPARAGTNISDEQVRAAAAYVWTLSR